MSPRKARNAPSEMEIDKQVIRQAEDESAWEKPVSVQRRKRTSLSLPADLAARAAFFTRLHREAKLDDWLRRIIQERLDLEEAAFTGLKRDLAAKQSR